MVIINRSDRSGVVSAAVLVCPYCGRAAILYARFCDRCGNDLSTFWKSVRPLVRHGYDQQWSLSDQRKAGPALKDAVQDLKSTLSASARRWKLLPKLTPDDVQSETSAIRSEKEREVEENLAEIENLRKERNRLSERTQELEAKLAARVPINELKAIQSDNVDLRSELSRLKEEKARSEARIAELTESVRGFEAKLAEAIPKSELETRQSEIATLQEELSKLTDAKRGSEAKAEKPVEQLAEAGMTNTLLPKDAPSEEQMAQLPFSSASPTLPPMDDERLEKTPPVLDPSAQEITPAIVGCYIHLDTQASSFCVICGRGICGECRNRVAADVYLCPGCWHGNAPVETVPEGRESVRVGAGASLGAGLSRAFYYATAIIIVLIGFWYVYATFIAPAMVPSAGTPLTVPAPTMPSLGEIWSRYNLLITISVGMFITVLVGGELMLRTGARQRRTYISAENAPDTKANSGS